MEDRGWQEGRPGGAGRAGERTGGRGGPAGRAWPGLGKRGGGAAERRQWVVGRWDARGGRRAKGAEIEAAWERPRRASVEPREVAVVRRECSEGGAAVCEVRRRAERAGGRGRRGETEGVGVGWRAGVRCAMRRREKERAKRRNGM